VKPDSDRYSVPVADDIVLQHNLDIIKMFHCFRQEMNEDSLGLRVGIASYRQEVKVRYVCQF
jgi:hypothetical protein